MKLKGKTIIVTGGSMGIGFTIAKQCAQEGAAVIVISRHADDLAKAVEQLPSVPHAKHAWYAADVGNVEQVRNIYAELKKSNTTIHGLVNAAGTIRPIGDTGQIDVSEFSETIKTNLIGTLIMSQHAMTFFSQEHRGKIINFAGGGATGAFPQYSAYAVSKVGIVRLTENIALEYRDTLDINAISPGFIATRMHQETINAGEKAGKKFLERTIQEMEKGGFPAERAAELAVFLLSSESDGISGKIISAQWDPWQDADFHSKLRSDADFCTLRRIDDQFFSKKSKQ